VPLNAKLILFTPATATEEEVIIDETTFAVTILTPDCTTMELIFAPTRLEAMEIDIGSNQFVDQNVPVVSDSGQLIEVGLCSVTSTLTVDGSASAFTQVQADAEADSGSVIRLSTPPAPLDGVPNSIGVHAGRLEFFSGSSSLDMLDFPVEITEPNCSTLRLTTITLNDMTIDYGSILTEV
jgi:hypothetical protein